MKRKGKRQCQTVWFWSKQEYVRFVQTVERLVMAVADLETILQEPKRRAQKAAATRKARAAAADAVAPMEALAVDNGTTAGPVEAELDTEGGGQGG